MALQTRWASFGLTVGTRLIARETVAVDTLARLATSWIFRACSLARTGSDTRKNEQFSTLRLGRTRVSARLHVCCDLYLPPEAKICVGDASSFANWLTLSLHNACVLINGKIGEAF